MTKVSMKKGTEFTRDGVHYEITGLDIKNQLVKLKVNGAAEQMLPRKEVVAMMQGSIARDGVTDGKEPEKPAYIEYNKFKMKNGAHCTVTSQDESVIHYREDKSGHKAKCSRKFFETDLIKNRDVILL